MSWTKHSFAWIGLIDIVHVIMYAKTGSSKAIKADDFICIFSSSAQFFNPLRTDEVQAILDEL